MEKHSVTGCGMCPFLSNEHLPCNGCSSLCWPEWTCRHPAYDGFALCKDQDWLSAIDPWDRSSMKEPPPTCPLRNHPVTITLA